MPAHNSRSKVTEKISFTLILYAQEVLSYILPILYTKLLYEMGQDFLDIQ